MMVHNAEKRKAVRDARVKDTAEIFTPGNLLPPAVWEENKDFLDPACGNGEILIWIVLRKMLCGHSPLEALKSVCGVDIMKDNVAETRARLLKVAAMFGPIAKNHVAAVCQNIVCANSLEYDFCFNEKISPNTVNAWMNQLEMILDKVDISNLTKKLKLKPKPKKK